MKNYDYLVVGSGLSGAVFANEAHKAGKTCLVLEKRKHIGGNIYCENIQNINVHKYGAHIFHTDYKEVWDYVNEIVEFNNFVNSPIANYNGEILNLPFNMNTFSKLWGISTPKEAEAIIADQKKEIVGEPKNLEEQAISLVGRDIFEKLIKGYTEKQWGRDCKDLPAFIIKRLPVRMTYDNNYFSDRYQGIPIGGYNIIIEKLLQNADVITDIDFLQNREEYTKKAAQVVYTGMVDAYFDYCFGSLEYRSLRLENEVLEKENHQGVAVVNYTQRDIPYTRIIEHKHFEAAKTEKTVITKEYPCEYKEGMEPYYPVNDDKNTKLYSQYEALAQNEFEKNGTIFLGRLAEYKYYDMDDAIYSVLQKTKEIFG
jgi:UDP-galactopyranose mutase